MAPAHLVLQYPDWQSGKIRLLASTKDRKALVAFKEAVLEEARLTLFGCDDDILQIEYQEELRKLEKLLDALVPDMLEAGDG
ncbi:hypothetical protein ACFLW6_04315 [Chloroflexota bacterium]